MTATAARVDIIRSAGKTTHVGNSGREGEGVGEGEGVKVGEGEGVGVVMNVMLT